jgi:hypothetical protein
MLAFSLSEAKGANMNKIQVSILALACSLGIRANAATIDVTYNFAGGPVGPEIPVGTPLTVDHFSTGSVLSGKPESERDLESRYVFEP